MAAVRLVLRASALAAVASAGLWGLTGREGDVLQAQQVRTEGERPALAVVRPFAVGVSPRVSALPAASPRPATSTVVVAELERGPRAEPVSLGEVDGALQADAAQGLMPSPATGFDGLSNADNSAVFGYVVLPPDTNGDVGPSHYVQMVNKLARVYSKAGAPLTAPFKLSALFTGTGTACADDEDGDVIVLYDPLADRWLLSSLAFLVKNQSPYHECIAVSTTPDPTGSYYVYDYEMPGNEFPDYPKFGVWPDAYYMTTAQFTNGTTYNGAGAFAFDRSRMLAGAPDAAYIYFNMPGASYPDISTLLPSDFDGYTPPPAGRPNTLAYLQATELGAAADAVRLFDFHADFVVPANSTLVERTESPVLVAAFDPTTPAGRADIRQPAPATDASALEAITDRLMHRLQYRSNGTVESLVVAHAVGAPASATLGTFRAGVRYYQFTRTIAGGMFGVLEQATYAPNDGVNRWMPSAAADHAGNLAVGFSASSTSVFPSARYAGRLASDAAGGLFQGEATLVTGAGSQTISAGRWGDYSAMSVDPVDDCTFWFTTEYYAASSSSGWQTRIGSFKHAACTPVAIGTVQGTVTNAANGTPVSGVSVQVSNGFTQTSGGAGTYTRKVSPGTYSITFSKVGYVPQTFAGVAVSNSGTTTLDVALVAIPVITANGAAIVSEGFAPANGAIEPGESVSVSFTLRNGGVVSTSSLVATLLASGGVTEPGAAVSVGAIPASGSASRTIAFRASAAAACASTLVASLQLADGDLDLGVVTFEFSMAPAGTAVYAQTFDGVVAPALPAGWTATNATGPLPKWVTTTVSPDTAPNALFVDDPGVLSDKQVTTPVMTAPAVGGQVSFRHRYDLESGYDGGVLEISVQGSGYQDIIAAGGSFVTGGYPRTISTQHESAIAGRKAWSGDSGGYVTTLVNLPPWAAGYQVSFRIRMASDSNTLKTGWWLDSFALLGRTCVPAAGDFMRNGTFSAGADGSDNWLKFALPGMASMPWSVTGGVFQFYRATGGTQAVVFQQTGVPVPRGMPLDAAFDIGNSAGGRRRVSVLVHEQNFTDLAVCTFWLEAGAPLRTYRMLTKTTKAWSNATISFYAATASASGNYQIDNVSLRTAPLNSAARVDCLDPTAPQAGAASSGTLLTNGGFDGGTIAPWSTFGNLSWQLSPGGLFEFHKLAGTPAGVLLQSTNAAMANDQKMQVAWQMANTSSVRQRVTVLMNDTDFSDLSACTFWLESGQPLSSYLIRSYATEAWTNAMISVYPASAGTAPAYQWLRMDNVSFQRVASAAAGTECVESGPVLSEVARKETVAQRRKLE